VAREGLLGGKAWQSVSWLVVGEATEEAAPGRRAPAIGSAVGRVAALLYSLIQSAKLATVQSRACLTGRGSLGHPEPSHGDAAGRPQAVGIAWLLTESAQRCKND
jgi:hypothetical protein